MIASIPIDEAIRLHASLAISAGAGTGKTYRLTERYCHHLLQGLSALEIVAVTFTELAANELRGRIREKVETLVASGTDALDRSVLAELEAAPISTLHGLAARICREHPEAAGVPAEFRLLDPVTDALWQSDQIDVALDRLPARVFERIPYEQARTVLGALLDDPLVAEQALAGPTEGWADLATAERTRALARLVGDPRWRDAAETVTTNSGVEPDLIEAQRKIGARALRALDHGEFPRGPLGEIAEVKLNGGKAANWPSGQLPVTKDALKVLRELAKGALKDGLVTLELGPADDTLQATLPLLKEAFELVRQHVDEAKRRQRVLTFADLEVHATRALQSPAVCAYYARRWRAFLVDEFQDTNRVQAAFLEALLAPAVLLTIVGDPKQSIYGFRRAESAVFERFRNLIVERGGHEIALSTSFRTHEALVNVVNRVSARLLADSHQELSAARQTAPHPGPHLRVYQVDPTGVGSSQEQQRWIEARHLAGVIRAMLDEKTLVHVRRGVTSEHRPIQPGDVAILARSWDTLDRYVDALAARGIPSVLTGGGSLLDTREAKDAIALLRFLADPADDIALAAVLRGPFFATSDPVLFRFASPLPKGSSWWATLAETSPPELNDARAILGELVEARQLLPPSRLLQLADRRCGYTAVIGNLPNARRREADWRGMLAFTRSLEAGSGDVFAVVRQLKLLIENEVGVPRPLLQADDAVALLTVHGAKGLEWPVVVLPDLARRPPTSRPPLYFDPDLGVALRFGEDSDDPDVPVLYTVLRVAGERREEAEARRVLYVGLTRARDHLILTSSDTSGPDLSRLAPGLAHAGVTPILIPFDAALARPPDPPDPPRPAEPERWLPDALSLGEISLSM